MAAKDSESPEKTLNARKSQETSHIEEGSTSVSNKSRQDKRQDTRNASSHKLKVWYIICLMTFVSNWFWQGWLMKYFIMDWISNRTERKRKRNAPGIVQEGLEVDQDPDQYLHTDDQDIGK